MRIQTFEISMNDSLTFIHPNEILLDIETTGLSPEVSTVFMIGCGYFEETRLKTIHWLADDLTEKSEQDILRSFSDWIYDRFKGQSLISLITFNGKQFDLPFLRNRFDQCRVLWPSILDTNSEHTDYYRIALRTKNLWPVSNLKLHSLASWLGFNQSKTPSGRQLIKAYHNYIKQKDPATLNLLYSHNKEDLEALAYVTSIQSYFHFFKGNYVLNSVEHSNDKGSITFCMEINPPFPNTLNVECFGFKMNLNGDRVRIIVPVYPQGLRFYYNDYKNYIYLINEGYALHKSMSAYIDKSHWIKATAENCYTWFSPDASFFQNIDKQKEYIQMILGLFGLF